MTTFAELVVKVSNNYKQATEDAARFEQQTAKTERATTSFANSSIILSQKVKSAIMAEDAAKLESHRKQIEMFTKQLTQLAEMKRVEERVTQEHQNQLNARLAAEKAYSEKVDALRKQAITKQISLSNEGNAKLLATIRETNARILAEEQSHVDKINKLKSQAMMGVSQGNAISQKAAIASSYMVGLSQQINPKILADQAAQAEKIKQFQNAIKESNVAIITTNAQQYRQQEQQLRDSLAKRLDDLKSHNAKMLAHQNAANQAPAKSSLYMVGLSSNANTTGFTGPTITPAQLAANQAHSTQIAQRTALYNNMTAALGRVNVQSQSSINMINGMSAAHRTEQERLRTANALYQDHINRLTMSKQAYHSLQLQQQGLTAAQANQITSMTHYSNSHNMLQRVLTKSLAIMTAMAAYRTLSFIITAPGELLTINKDMELLKIRLEALTGTIEKGRVAFKDLVSLDFKTPFNIEELTKAFLTLKNYGINPTERVMTALTDTISKMGGTSENLVGVSTQLGQAWSKGKLQMQDMRVIIENGVPIISLLAKTLNVSNAEILRMSKQGEITTDVMSKLFDTMERESAGGSARMMNSLAGAISNVHSSFTLLVDALLEDKSESAIRRIFEAWSAILKDWTSSITGVIDLNNELMKNWSDLADVRTQIERAEKYPIYTTIKGQFGGNTLADLKEKEAVILEAQDKIVAGFVKEAKARSENNKESVTDVATNRALLLQEEKKQENLDKFYETSLSLDDKYNKSMIKNTNSSIDVQIAKIKDITEAKVKSYELDMEVNNANFKNNEQTAHETYMIQMDYISKIRSIKLKEIDEIAKLENSKIQESTDNHKKMFDAILIWESHRAGPYKGGAVNRKSRALGEAQVLPSTAMDPGIEGVKALDVVKAKGKEFFKGSIEDIQEFVRDNEQALRDFGESYYNGLVRKLGSNAKAIQAYGEHTPEYLKGVLDVYEKMDGSVEKQNQLTIKQMDLEKQRSEVLTSSSQAELEARQTYNDSKKKSNKLTESQIKKVNELRDAEIDRYNKATMSESKYYIEKLKHTEKSPGVLLNEQDIATISGPHDRANIAEEQAKSYEKARESLIKYNDNIGLAKESLSAMAQIGNTAFDGQLGGISTVTGALDKMVSALQDNVKEFEKLAKIQKENENFIPKNDEDKKLQAELKIKYEKEYGSLETKNTMIAIDGVRQLASATSNMFEQNSNAAKAFNIIALAGLAAKAAGAILTQGEGDPYTAFARIAAMGSIVAAIMATAGAGGFNFSGSGPTMSKENLAKVNGTGTVLGDNETASTSVDKTYELLKSIHASEYTELRGINSGINSLVSNISGTVNNAFKGGNLTSLTTAESRISQTAKNFNTAIMAWAAIVNPLAALSSFVLSKIPVIGDAFNKTVNWIVGGLFGKVSHAIIGTGISTDATNVNALLNGKGIEAKKFDVDQTTKSSWFKTSYKYDVKFSQLDKNISDSLDKVFSNIGTTMLQVSQLLGNEAEEALRKYVIPGLTIDLKGLSGEEASKKVNAIISSTMDNMAQAVFGNIVEQYQKLGEGILETAIRIVSEIAVVKDALSVSGLAISTNAIGISDALVQAAGGLEEFQKQFDIFYDKFYSDAEKQSRLTENLRGQLSGIFSDETIKVLGQARENYRKVIEAIEVNTTSGQTQLSLLYSLAGAADTYYTALEKGADDAFAAIEERTKLVDSNVNKAMTVLQKAVATERTKISDTYNASIKTTEASISALTDSVSKLQSLSDMLVSSLNDLNPISFSDAKNVLKQSLNQAQSGNISAIDQNKLKLALDSVNQINENSYKTAFEFKRDKSLTSIDISNLSNLTTNQLSTEQLLLENSKSQLELLKTTYESDTKRLDDLLSSAQEQIDAVNGTTIAVLSVERAMQELRFSLEVKRVDNNVVNKSYQSYSNEDILAYGKANNISTAKGWYEAALKYNANPYQVGAALGLSLTETEKALHDAYIPGFATGGIHAGGWRIVGENGPELENTGPSHIFNNSDSMEMLDNRLLIQEVKELKEELKRMREDMRAGHSTIANNTKESTKQLKKWDTDGMPEVRTI